MEARSGATRDATGTVRTIAAAAWIESSRITARHVANRVLANDRRRIEVAGITRIVLLLEAHDFAAMEDTVGTRASAIARDNRVGELSLTASTLILAVYGAILYLELDAAVIDSAVLTV